jgi:P4 family phage/plasmid primase-like protien
MVRTIRSEIAETFRKANDRIPQSPEQRKNLPNETIASMFSKLMGDRLIYDKSICAFWIWNEAGFWMPVTDPDDIREPLMNALIKWGVKGLTMSKIDDIISQLRLFTTRTEDLDDHFISFDDCLWSPVDGSTAEKSPEKVAVLHVPTTFSGLVAAECPKFDAYLKETCIDEDGGPNQGMIDQLQQYAGYLLWPKIDNCPCLFFYGEGSNGKSVFVDVMRGLVGESRTRSCGLEQLIGNKFGMASLVGARFNSSDEMGNCRESTTENFKKMILGERLTAERKFGDQFDFTPKCKFVFCTNRIPAFSEVNVAIKRRILIIPFRRTLDPFTEDGRRRTVRHLGRIIARDELPGVVRWAMEGLEKLKANNFWIPITEDSLKMMNRFEEESSSVIEYLRESFTYDSAYRTYSKEAYGDYAAWCREVGRKPVSRISFGRDFSEVFGKPVSSRINGKIVPGYRCRKNDQLPAQNPFI